MSSTVPTGIGGNGKLSTGPLSGRGRSFHPTAPARPSSGKSPSSLPGHLKLSIAGAGDHPSIHHLLLSVFHAPSQAEFQAQLEEPSYEPTDRLVIKRDERVVSHLRMANREMFFGAMTLPVSFVSDIATLPEYENVGCATALLNAAEEKVISEGAALAMLRTNIPQFYRRRGWTVCGRHSFSTARPRDILSYLSATQSAHDSGPSIPNLLSGDSEPLEINIRLWRHVERAALLRLYEENTACSFGAIRRSEAYWRWLISRRGYDRIYIAIEGPDKLELDDQLDPIVGYAAMKDGRIVELMTSPGHPLVASQLLARACGDAIERDYHSVRFDGPPNDPLHQAIELAGGKHFYHEAEDGEVFMVKLFDPPSFLRSLCPQLHERAKAADISRPCELGLSIDDEKYQFVLTRRSVKLTTGKLGRSYITCSTSQLVQMMLGHVNVQDAAEAGRLESSTRIGVEIASALFPHLPLWHPPLDDLSA